MSDFAFSVYPVTDSVQDWLSHGTGLWPVESSAFYHWRERQHLIRLVHKAETGNAHPYAALAAINDHNADNGDNLTYQEVLTLSTDGVFSDAGEWVIFTSHPCLIVMSDYDDPVTAMVMADERIEWIILLLPMDGEMVVYRSPHVEERMSIPVFAVFHNKQRIYASGMERRGSEGDVVYAYTLPPGIEGAIRQDFMKEEEEKNPDNYRSSHEPTEHRFRQ